MREVVLGTWGVREITAHIAGWHGEMLPALERVARGRAALRSGDLRRLRPLERTVRRGQEGRRDRRPPARGRAVAPRAAARRGAACRRDARRGPGRAEPRRRRRRRPLSRARRPDPRVARARGALRAGRAETRFAARRHHALSRAPAPGAAADAPAHRGTPVSVRRGRRWRAAGLDQRAGSGPLPDAVESLRALRARPARSARLPPAAAVRVLGPRGLPVADLDAAVVATRDARLSGAAHRLVRLAAAQPADAAAGPRRPRAPRAQGQRP